MKVLLLKGGPDAEREVSLMSGGQVAAALRRAGVDVNEIIIDRPTLAELRAMSGDVVFPVLHGPWGEGGGMQELLAQDGRPYVGCEAAAARLAMDKPLSKRAVAEVGVPTPASQVIRAGDSMILQPPLVLKPCDEGSSVDLRVCQSPEEVQRGLGALLRRQFNYHAAQSPTWKSGQCRQTRRSAARSTCGRTPERCRWGSSTAAGNHTQQQQPHHTYYK
jgi:D-alanine-D-alanine ligase